MLKPLPFRPSGAMLLVEPQVLERLSAFRQMETSAPEAGGILMGYRRGPHTHVTEATVPTSRDAQRRFGFFRHATHHQRVALRRWKESGETMDYVGEWHTHPEDDPSPSGVDFRHWREIAQASTRPMVFLIVGRSSNWCGVGLKNNLTCVSGANF
ncbi:MAG: Mov34/MPN/PAD-1 family protein [Sterolibacteriaceae bacterium]|uniref:Mov34/MPN/PAD-1 family protein n=1 Tax=Candidatus Methylophosphatis roskildensis TaxID=2899263 RepID=A0A9D7E8M9_9PROT|nr:Mov34/MPN/PAD-1 family protein [Candidatus Methylophosphatis roskildensis]MBK7238301.1 Mov34/MPN/PAD-1 family protein [Sterolibacteriaceae bacterium]